MLLVSNPHLHRARPHTSGYESEPTRRIVTRNVAIGVDVFTSVDCKHNTGGFIVPKQVGPTARIREGKSLRAGVCAVKKWLVAADG